MHIPESIRRYWVPGAFFFILGLGVAGFLTSSPPSSGVLDAIYRTLQLFALEYPEKDMAASFWLEAARFLAAAFSTLTVLTLLVPWVVRWLVLAAQSLFRMRAIVLGYGPSGQALARELRSRDKNPFRVTAVHHGATPAQIGTARRDGVILVDGDPSDPKTYRRIRLKQARKIFAALDNDMHTLDAAEAARGKIGKGKAEVVALLTDPDIAAGLADSSPRGFLGGPGIRGYCLAEEAAQALIADARFDRVALEAGHKRVHLVIIGCGAQGEAVAIETLLTAWRVELDPPKITIFDRNIGPVRARFKRRSPAFSIGEGEPGRLPASARPEMVFHALNLEKIDFGRDDTIERLCGDDAQVTGWVFAAGDDSLNLRGALALHTAMLRRQRAAAPIHVRIWNRHAGDTPVLSRPHVSIAQTFGSHENAIAATTACDLDPDAGARKLHAQYLDIGRKMRNADFEFSDSDWKDLSETKKAANRRLHRHAVMKLEDLKAQWRRGARALPTVDPELKDRHLELEAAFDYKQLKSGSLPTRWWRDGEGFEPRPGDDDRVARIKNVAVTEHNRWTVDRAIDGWMLPPPGSKRDDERRWHPSLGPWDDLDQQTKRWDAVLLRSLIASGSGNLTAWKQQVSSLVLALGALDRCRVLPRWIGRDPGLTGGLVTQIDLAIIGSVAPEHAEAAALAARRMTEALLADGLMDRLCRLRFVFHAPPSAEVLLVGNAVADAVADRKVEVSSSWLWSGANPPAVGFVGHRDLDRLAPGGGTGLAEHLERLFASVAGAGRVSRLISGYAPGADRIAVERWNGLNLPPPELVFPFVDPSTGDFLTDELAQAGPDERVTGKDAKKIGKPRLAAPRTGGEAHSAQALDIIENCGVLIAVYDGKGPSGTGSVGDTIAQAKARGLAVIEVTRGADGAFHNNES